MKYLSVICFFLCTMRLPAQTDKSLRLFNEYPLEMKEYFINKIWLKKKLWESMDDESGRTYFYSRSDARNADIRLIPVFTPSVKTIEEYDSSKNILDFLIAAPSSCFIALVSRNKTMIGLIESRYTGKNNKGRLETIIENFKENKQGRNFQNAFLEGNPIYYDNVLRMYCKVDQGEVLIYYGFEKKWILFKEFISGRVKSYKELAKLKSKD